MITAEATVQLLTYMSKQKYATVWRDALPIAGVDGTLRNRMKGHGRGKQPARKDWFTQLGGELVRLCDQRRRREPGVLDHGQ